MPVEKKPVTSEKTYDSVFWTAVVKMKKYVVHLVNLAFGERFTEAADVELMPSKQVMQQYDGSFDTGEEDSVMTISEMFDELVRKKYHFELESKPNDVIALRLAEYGASMAYDSVKWEDGEAVMTIPHSAVIFLRSTKNTPEKYSIIVRYPGGQVR